MERPHVPAWKKLGLKLKFTNITADTRHEAPPLRKREFESEIPSPPVTYKKRRVDSHSESTTSNRCNDERVPKTPPTKERMGVKKRVSFTPDTKTSDGDSSRSMIADWEAEYARQQAGIPSGAVQAKQPVFEKSLKSSTEVEPKSNSESKVEPKLKSRSKAEQNLKAGSFTPRKATDALQYLTQYRQDRSSWKFNKNREVWIFKHILSTTDIPPPYNLALAHYIYGLKSHGARLRISEQCKESLSKDSAYQASSKRDGLNVDSTLDSNMDDPERRRAYHEAALRRFKRNLAASLDEEEAKSQEEDPEFQTWLSRRKRAEILLWSIESSPFSNGTTPASSSNGALSETRLPVSTSTSVDISVSPATVNKKGKEDKRKKRTTVIDISSSSDDESESDDDSSENSDSSSDTPRNGSSGGPGLESNKGVNGHRGGRHTAITISSGSGGKRSVISISSDSKPARSQAAEDNATSSSGSSSEE